MELISSILSFNISFIINKFTSIRNWKFNLWNIYTLTVVFIFLNLIFNDFLFLCHFTSFSFISLDFLLKTPISLLFHSAGSIFACSCLIPLIYLFIVCICLHNLFKILKKFKREIFQLKIFLRLHSDSRNR